MLEKIENLQSKTDRYSVIIIWLHGLGATADDFKHLPDDLMLPENLGVKYILPQAPLLSVTLNNGMMMPAWYDIVGLDKDSPQDINGALHSASEIEQIIKSEIQMTSEAVKVFVGGFSQGGSLALLVAARTNIRLSGIICCSGYLLKNALLDSALKHQHTLSQPILLCHGNEDDIVKKEWGLKAYSDLNQKGYLVDWHCYPNLGHSVSMQELTDISNFITTKL